MHILHMYCRFCGSTGMCLPLKRVGDIAFCFLGVDILLLSLMRGHIMSPDNLSFLSFYLSILFCILLIQIFHIFYDIVQFNIMLDFQIFSVSTWFMWFCQWFCWYAFMTINNLEYKIILNLYIFLGGGGGGGSAIWKNIFSKLNMSQVNTMVCILCSRSDDLWAHISIVITDWQRLKTSVNRWWLYLYSS